MPDYNPIEGLTKALADRYRMDRQLGEGGMATVYLAHDLKHDRDVAIKVLRPELAAVIGADRFLSEIKTTANLQHPHILPLFDSGNADGQLFYVMPYVEGETLRGRLVRETQLPVADAVRLATEIASALDYAHKRGVVHRDIKPENILIQHGSALVADFGIALAVQQAGGERMTQTGMSLGTPQYMSPEQAMGQKSIDARSDLYALGAITYEMLIGEPPFTGPSAQAIVAKVMTESPKELTAQRKTVPGNVAAAVANALEKLPADRFASAAAFAEALANPGFGHGGAATSARAVASRRPANRLALAAAAVALLAVGVAAGGVLLRGKPITPRVVRFTMATMAAQRVTLTLSFDTPFALSPDGSRIVFAARDSASSRTRLFVRAIDQLAATPLAGTEDAINPFFSPDGLWIGFATFSDRTVRKVAAGGGPVSALAGEAALSFGAAAWGDDGVITFTLRGGALARVSSGGGTATVVTDSLKVGAALAPKALPGGRAVIFAACPDRRDDCRTNLYAVDVASRKMTMLVENARRGWYMKGGLLVYGTADGALYAVTFDAKKLAVTSAPVALVDGVTVGRSRLPLAAVSDSGTMAYLPGVGLDNSVVVQVERGGREQVVIAKPGPYFQPRLSPDGRRIVMTLPDTKKALQIWIHDRSSGTTSQLTFEGENERPAWSPDGKRVAFTTARGGKNSIWSAPADGSGPGERAGEGPMVTASAAVSWTRDGRYIVIDGARDDGKGAGSDDILAIPTSGTRTLLPVVATPASEQTGEVSPDGKWVAFVSDEAGKNQIYVAPFMAKGGRTLVSSGGATQPAWVSNNELAYVSTETDSLMLARLEFGPTIKVTRAALFDARNYERGSSTFRNYDVSRDGKSFIFVRSTSQRAAIEPVFVANWVEEVRRLMAATGAP